MSEYNKQRYYWIKLTDKFMTSDTVDFLMSQKDGANYVILYQMLCLKTINNNGELARELGEIIVPYNEEKIQRDTKWFSIDTIRVAMNLYRKLGLIYEQENGMLRISNFENMIGSQTISAYKKQVQLENRGGKKVEFFPPDIDKDKEIKILEKDIKIIDKENNLNNNNQSINESDALKGMLAELSILVPPIAYKTFFENISSVGLVGNRLYLKANSLVSNAIDENYRDKVLEALEKATNGLVVDYIWRD